MELPNYPIWDNIICIGCRHQSPNRAVLCNSPHKEVTDTGRIRCVPPDGMNCYESDSEKCDLEQTLTAYKEGK